MSLYSTKIPYQPTVPPMPDVKSPRKKRNMEWNVFVCNVNKQKIETYNVFEHSSFSEYVSEHLKECKTKEEFAERLKSELRYYFGFKAEWEVLVSPWVGGDREKDTIKIDVFDQVMSNWEIFVDYVWGFRK